MRRTKERTWGDVFRIQKRLHGDGPVHKRCSKAVHCICDCLVCRRVRKCGEKCNGKCSCIGAHCCDGKCYTITDYAR